MGGENQNAKEACKEKAVKAIEQRLMKIDADGTLVRQKAMDLLSFIFTEESEDKVNERISTVLAENKERVCGSVLPGILVPGPFPAEQV